MFTEFKGETLEEAYEKATKSLQCSITDLTIDIIQTSSKGFLGFFAKEAIIKVSQKNQKVSIKEPSIEQKIIEEDETLTSRLNALNKKNPSKEVKEEVKVVKELKKEKIFNDFYENNTKQVLHGTPIVNKPNDLLVKEIKLKINNLFSNLCYELDEIKVKILEDNQTVYIEFSGKDSALLIGKEGYRYKALSYILFNWLNEKYNMMLRLEIAEFLSNQEEAVYTYLEPVIQIIREEGFYKTKKLDGILIHIALNKLRVEFPDKYVAVKTNIRGDKYILVNEYRN